MSEDTHKLVDALATSRARVAEPQTSRKGGNMTRGRGEVYGSRAHPEEAGGGSHQGPVHDIVWQTGQHGACCSAGSREKESPRSGKDLSPACHSCLLVGMLIGHRWE